MPYPSPSHLPQHFNFLPMLFLVGVYELNVVSFVCPISVGPGKLSEEHILLLHFVHLGIVGGNDACEEDGGEQDTEKDSAEPPPNISGCEESPDVIPGQKVEPIANHVFPLFRLLRLGDTRRGNKPFMQE